MSCLNRLFPVAAARTCRLMLGLVLGLTAWLGLPGLVAAAPKPAAVPQRWALDFQPGELRLFTDGRDGRVYWFFTYKVTNSTDQDLIYAPEFTLLTENGDILVSGRDVPS